MMQEHEKKWIEWRQMGRIEMPSGAPWSLVYLRQAQALNEDAPASEPLKFDVRLAAASATGDDHVEVVGKATAPELGVFFSVAEREIRKRFHSGEWTSGKVYEL